jgi:hypothetical protein
MSSPDQIIQIICPPLAGSPSLSAYVEMATSMTDQGFYGALYAQAIALRAAHMFTLDSRFQSAAGAISGLKTAV